MENIKTLFEIERDHIVNTLDSFKGNKTKTASTLGISYKTLYNKLHMYQTMFPGRYNFFCSYEEAQANKRLKRLLEEHND